MGQQLSELEVAMEVDVDELPPPTEEEFLWLERRADADDLFPGQSGIVAYRMRIRAEAAARAERFARPRGRLHKAQATGRRGGSSSLMEKLRVDIRGLDLVLGGGIPLVRRVEGSPESAVVLLRGPPGSGSGTRGARDRRPR
jgi:hypothetical protein